MQKLFPISVHKKMWLFSTETGSYKLINIIELHIEFISLIILTFYSIIITQTLAVLVSLISLHFMIKEGTFYFCVVKYSFFLDQSVYSLCFAATLYINRQGTCFVNINSCV
jgi:hypothetical protein